jgi:hypothetical protein
MPHAQIPGRRPSSNLRTICRDSRPPTRMQIKGVLPLKIVFLFGRLPVF